MDETIRQKCIDRGIRLDNVDEFFNSEHVDDVLSLFRTVILEPTTTQKDFVVAASLYILFDAMSRITQG